MDDTVTEDTPVRFNIPKTSLTDNGDLVTVNLGLTYGELLNMVMGMIASGQPMAAVKIVTDKEE